MFQKIEKWCERMVETFDNVFGPCRRYLGFVHPATRYCEECRGKWKGENVGRTALHNWVRRRKSKPEFCDNCKKKKPFDLANISGKYKRDISDYLWLCRRCHMKSDGRLKLFLEKKEREVPCSICGIITTSKTYHACCSNTCKQESQRKKWTKRNLKTRELKMRLFLCP